MALKIMILWDYSQFNSLELRLISKDEKYIISGASDGTIKIWDIKKEILINSLSENNLNINSITISNDGKYIISGSSGHTVNIWDYSSGKLIKKIYGHNWNVNDVSLSKDNKYIVSASADNSIKIWNREKGLLVKTLRGHKGYVHSVTVSVNGKYIVSGSADNTIKLWDMKKQKLLKTFKGHTKTVGSVLITPNNKMIISASKDKTIKFWDLRKGTLIKSIDAHDNYVRSILMDNNKLVSASWDTKIKLWDIKNTNKEIKQFIGGAKENWIVFDYKKKLFFRGDDGVLLLNKKWKELSKDGKTGVRKLTPLYPSDYNLSKKDNLTLNISKKKRIIVNDTNLTLKLNIENQGEQNSYFMVVNGESKHLLVEQQRVDKVKKGESREFELTVYAKLDQLNPQPIEENLNIIVITGNGTRFSKIVPISIAFAKLEVIKAEVSEDGKNLNVKVQNRGTQKLLKADVNLSSPFQADIQSITSLEANGSKTLSFALPENNQSIEGNLSISFSVPNDREIKINPSTTKIAPAYVWDINNITIVLKKMAWYIYALMVLGALFFIWSVWYYKRYKNPIVLKLTKTPNALKTLTPNQLKEAKTKLEKIKQLESILALAEVKEKNLTQALAFFEGNEEQKAELFAQHIGAKSCVKEGEFYRLNMSDAFNLNNLTTLLLYFGNEKSEQELKEINDKVLVFASSEKQESMETLAQDKSNRLVAPSAKELTGLMLSSRPQEELVTLLAKCLSFKDVSPYQINGDVKNESNFFGRVEILREIIANNSSNYLLVGARQLGKSSILKALERRYAGSSTVNCYAFTLDESGDVLGALAEVLETEATLEQIVLAINQETKRPIFLIDEVDSFIRHEKERGYLITSVFRKLAQEGKAMFVLAGFWTLYEYVSLDYQSPLKNFGKLITLEGLEKEACVELMIEPMRRIGVSYENESIIERTISLCGERANYIATICDVMLQSLEGSMIKEQDLEKALNHKEVARMLKGWEAMTSNEEKNKIDRLIVYLTIEQKSFRLGDVIEGIKKQGLTIDTQSISESLERLVLGYVLSKEKGNYSYNIPLMQKRIVEDDLAFLLEGEVLGLC